MIRTQIQLPDELYAQAKKLCEEKEISFAEFARRGVEHMTRVFKASSQENWTPPKPQPLGWNDFSEDQLKELAQESHALD